MARRQDSGRRKLIAGLGAVATAGALGGRAAMAQETPATPFVPLFHPQDAWMANMPGTHRVVIDVDVASGVAPAIRYANNLFDGSKSGYDVEEADMAILVCLRAAATPYGYGDTLWTRYGASFEPDTRPAPIANPYNSGSRLQLAALARRGVQFMVCATASRGIATRLAGPNGDVDAILKAIAADLVPSGRLVVAGVVAVTHAQERGFAMLHAG